MMGEGSRIKYPGSQPPMEIGPFEPDNASNFDISRLKFCPHCGQLLPQQKEMNAEQAIGSDL